LKNAIDPLGLWILDLQQQNDKISNQDLVAVGLVSRTCLQRVRKGRGVGRLVVTNRLKLCRSAFADTLNALAREHG